MAWIACQANVLFIFVIIMADMWICFYCVIKYYKNVENFSLNHHLAITDYASQHTILKTLNVMFLTTISPVTGSSAFHFCFFKSDFFFSRKQKIKVDRSKIKEMCGVKRSCFDNLVTEMEKLADTLLGGYRNDPKFSGGARWLSGRVSDSGARGPGFETYRRRVVSLSKTLYSPKVLVNYPGSDGSVPI